MFPPRIRPTRIHEFHTNGCKNVMRLFQVVSDENRSKPLYELLQNLDTLLLLYCNLAKQVEKYWVICMATTPSMLHPFFLSTKYNPQLPFFSYTTSISPSPSRLRLCHASSSTAVISSLKVLLICLLIFCLEVVVAHQLFANLRFALMIYMTYVYKENLGRLSRNWSDITSLNYWVVRDYHRLVNSVNTFEIQIQRLSDEQVHGF